MAIAAFNGYGMLSGLGDTIQQQNDAANQQAQQLYQQAQSSQLLGQTGQLPQHQSFVNRMLAGLGGAQPPAPAPQRILAPAEASLGATPAPTVTVGNASTTPVAPTAAALPAKDAYGLYRGMGIPDTGAKAIIAGLQGESGQNLNPTVANNSGTETGGIINPDGSFGVAQWNGDRQAKLLNFARQNNSDPRDAATQHKFVAWEMQHNYPDVWATINDPSVSAQDKLAAFVNKYENPANKQQEIARRSQFLNADYGGGAAPISPISPGGAPTAAPVGTPAVTTIDKMRAMDPSQLAVIAAGNPTLAPVAKALMDQKIKQMGVATYRQVTDPAERAAAGYGEDDKRPLQQNTQTLEYKAGTATKAQEESGKPHVVGPGGALVGPKGDVLYKAPSADTMPDQSADFLAERVLVGDSKALVGLGRGAQGAQNISKVQQLVAQKAAERGIDAKDMLEATAEQAGLNAQQRKFGTQTAAMATSSTEAQGAISLGREASANVPRGNWVPVTKAIQAWQAGTSDPMLAKFGAANNAIINTYARAINPTGVPTVNDKQHAEAMLSTATGPEAYNAVLDQMRSEIDIAQKSPQVSQQMLRNIRKGKPALEGITEQHVTQESGPFTPSQATDKPAGGMTPPPKLGSVPVPISAAQLLKQKPALRAYFDAKYGAGASDTVLGQGR